MRNTVVLAIVLLASSAFSLKVSDGHLHKKTHAGGHSIDMAMQIEMAMQKVIDDEAHQNVVFPVPTAVRCIVMLTLQYMIIYTCLAVCRTYHEFGGTRNDNVEAGLSAAAQTLTYAPMICVLFIACRMRVDFLSKGKDQPQYWVQICMYAITFAVLSCTLLVLCLPLIVGRPLPLAQDTCDLERPGATSRDSKVAFYMVSSLRYAIMLGLYGGLAGVIVGMCTYMPPGTDDIRKVPAPAPAVWCTMVLAIVFFSTQLVIVGCRTNAEITGVELPRAIGIAKGAATTVEFAPMLSIVFLAARMRALQHGSQPQAWAQQCMYAATCSLCMTTVLAIIGPLILGGSLQVPDVARATPRGLSPRGTTLQFPNNQALGRFIIATRFFFMFCFYGGVFGVIYSTLTFVAPDGPAATAPVSPTVHCVTNLTCQYFFVYLVMIICSSVHEFSGGADSLESFTLYVAVDASKATVALAPMLSILFVATRMYALLITDKKGSPQAWVQDGMYMATWSLLISFMSCLTTGLVMKKVEVSEDGHVITKFNNWYVAVSMTCLRYFTMLLLYGGIATVVCGIFVMTPETANGRGSIPVLSDVIDSINA
jgi:hypothetical protein